MTSKQIERYLAGNLDARALKAVEAQLAANASLRARVDARRQDKAAFLLDPRRRRFADLIVEAETSRSVRRPAWPHRLAWVALLGASAAAGMMLLWPAGRGGIRQSVPSESSAKYAVKGGVSVRLAVQRAGRVHPYVAGSSLHVGDRVRISVDDPHGGFVTVLFEDERKVDVLYRPDEAKRLPPGQHFLPGSFELDAVTGRERIYVLVSPQVPPIDDWRAQIESARTGAGFNHGWLPKAPTRIATIEYQKVSK